jgi:hypothetical protein
MTDLKDKYWRELEEDRLSGPDVGRGPAFDEIYRLEAQVVKLRERVEELEADRDRLTARVAELESTNGKA